MMEIFERRLIVDAFDDGRHLLEARDPGGPPAPLAGHELEVTVGPRPHEDGLQDAVLADRRGEVLEGLLVEALPGLVRVRADPSDGQLADLGHGAGLVGSEQVDERRRVGGPLGREPLGGLAPEVGSSQERSPPAPGRGTSRPPPNGWRTR